MTKLFKVTCTITYLAVEKDERSATVNASRFAREHIGDAVHPFDDVKVGHINTKDQVPRGWLKAIPYGDASEGNTPVSGYLSESPKEDGHE